VLTKTYPELHEVGVIVVVPELTVAVQVAMFDPQVVHIPLVSK